MIFRDANIRGLRWAGRMGSRRESSRVLHTWLLRDFVG